MIIMAPVKGGTLSKGQGSGRAFNCIGCGQCEGVCSQHLPIFELLKDASTKPDGGRRYD